MPILKPERITITTPIEELRGLKTSVRIFLKRDDLNGLLISGNKARKLEYLIADMKRKKCDTIITCGPVQSNHCRTTAVFAQQYGYECHLLLRAMGKPASVDTGNLLLDRLLGAKIRYITPRQYERRLSVMEEYARVVRKKGRKPYCIPEGGSNEIGSLGYLDCMREMADFIKKQRIDAVYCAVGSGGTYAGLLLGKKLCRLAAVHLHGIIICDTIEYFKKKISEICRNAIDAFTLRITLAPTDIDLVDGYVGDGYGIPYLEELQTIKRIAKLGIILEPVYTGKAFYGMLNHVTEKGYKKVIFIHTGGIFSIFAFSRTITATLRQ
jgi:D-cysteine desulfhydrase